MKTVALSLLVVTAAACSTELNPAGREVRVAKAVPHENCQELAVVYGSGTGAGYTSSEDKMRSAQNDLRNNAASRGANIVVLDAAGADVSGFAFSGRAFQCGDAPDDASSVVVVDERQEQEPEQAAGFVAPKSEEKAAVIANSETNASEDGPAIPTGSVGFRFGHDRAKASETCANAGHVWTRSKSKSGCSGLPVPLGVPGQAEAQFCGEKLCKVILTLRPEEKALVGKLNELRDLLEQRYGRPDRLVDTLSGCGEKPSKCLKEDAMVHLEWYWSSGQAIELDVRPAQTSQESPLLLVTHTRNKRQTPSRVVNDRRIQAL